MAPLQEIIKIAGRAIHPAKDQVILLGHPFLISLRNDDARVIDEGLDELARTHDMGANLLYKYDRQGHGIPFVLVKPLGLMSQNEMRASMQTLKEDLLTPEALYFPETSRYIYMLLRYPEFVELKTGIVSALEHASQDPKKS